MINVFAGSSFFRVVYCLVSVVLGYHVLLNTLGSEVFVSLLIVDMRGSPCQIVAPHWAVIFASFMSLII